MNKAFSLWLLAAFFLATVSSAVAQQPEKIPRIGFLSASAASTSSARPEAFRQGLRELGYIEGNSIIIEWRYVEGKPEQIHSLAAELVRLKVDILVTAGPTPTRAAKGTTATIPIVMMQDPDPVGNGFVTSLARPGGNITGLSTHAPEISGKQLEILKESIPKLSRVATLGTSASPGYALSIKEMEIAADALGVKLQHVDMPINPNEIETAFRAASKGRADALVVLGGAVVSSQRALMAELAVKNRLPVMYYSRTFVEAGGLMTYAANLRDLDRRAATYVDKILKGRKPADLPVEQPTKFEFIINLKAAKAIGLTIPPNVLARANRIIR